jgi:hypothetical protein
MPSPDPTQTHGQELARDLIALCRNTSRGLVDDTHSSNGEGTGLDDIDYWYRLGQRNAYSQAAGLLLAPAAAEDPFVIAERITTRLDAGVTDIDELNAAAYGPRIGDHAGNRADGLKWLGPRAFVAQYGPGTPADRHYGMRWCARGDQRITLRPNAAGDRGLLFAYDPTWDEYAVLADDVQTRAVDAALQHAVQIDIHLDPGRFAQLVREHATRSTATHAAEPEAQAAPAELGAQL